LVERINYSLAQRAWCAHMASPALDKLLDLLAKDFKVVSVHTDWTAVTGDAVVTVHLRKGSLEENLKASDSDFCDYASALYSSP